MATENAPTFNYDLLTQPQEDALHAQRFLAPEERPLTRLQKTLLRSDSLLLRNPRPLPTPPPEGEGEAEAEPNPEEHAAKLARFRTEVLLDFSYLESSLFRIQHLHSANARERARYAASKAEILSTAQSVRDNTVSLRQQLAESQKVLELRKGYDELAGKILDDKKLKSREECQGEIETLEKEIAELQQDGADFEAVWRGRKEGFERVVAEGEAVLKMIKGVKDEVEEEDEAMEEGEGEDGTKGDGSRMGTPGPGGRTPMPAEGGETPVQGSGTEVGSATPARPGNRLLDVEGATHASSGAATPLRQDGDAPVDVDMGDDSEIAEQPPAKTSEGMEATVNQVIEPAEAVVEQMDET